MINKRGDLRVWWMPQLQMKPFYVHVATLVEAKLLLNTLADYDQFQLDNNIKPDYSNTGGLEVFNSYDGNEWVDWADEEGDSIDDWSLEELREFSPSVLPSYQAHPNQYNGELKLMSNPVQNSVNAFFTIIFLIFFTVIIGFFCYLGGQNSLKEEAIKAGVAELVPNPKTLSFEFKWKTDNKVEK